MLLAPLAVLAFVLPTAATAGDAEAGSEAGDSAMEADGGGTQEEEETAAAVEEPSATLTIDDLPSEPLNLGDLRNIAAGICAYAESADGSSAAATSSRLAPPVCSRPRRCLAPCP